MDKKIILIIIIALILSGFIFAFMMNSIALEGRVNCTKIGCNCAANPEAAELPCNFCTKTTYYYYTSILNVEKSCQAREIIICENGEQVGEKIGEYDDCSTEIYFLTWRYKLN